LVVVGDHQADRVVALRLGAEELDAVAARRLRGVQRGVGLADERVGGLAAPGWAGHADADRHEPALGMRNRKVLDDAAQARGGERGGVERLLGEEDEELLAAVAVDGVAAAHRGGEGGADAAQQMVTLEVAGAVVEALEVVDVDERDAPAMAVALRAG